MCRTRHYRLWVRDSVNGAPVTIASRVPQTDLYDIVNCRVLPPKPVDTHHGSRISHR
jgi:hypothetical protein